MITPTEVVQKLLESEGPYKISQDQLAEMCKDPKTHHHLRLTYDCGCTETCRCTAKKTEYQVEGLCWTCSRKG